MSFLTMASEIRGSVPKLSFNFAQTLVNRAWKVVREANLWSFNLFESSWITPPLVTTGTVTATQGSATITFDANAIAALLASMIQNPYSPITIRQFRIGVGGIYSLVSLDPNFATNGIATLDRIFGDPSGAGMVYQVYQLYYAAPFADHRAWLSVRNPQMFIDLDLTRTRAQIDAMDPQRSWYQFPTCVVPYARDTRPGSATLGYPLFELWGQPVAPFTYQCYGLRNGLDLVNPGDTIPQPLDEDLVLAKARSFAYNWAEANKDITPRATGPDFRFLIGNAEREFKDLKVTYRRQDREFVLNWFIQRSNILGGHGIGYYNTLAGFAGPYGMV
jgi:hypothetical protein